MSRRAPSPLLKPEHLFLVLALPFGIIFALLLPPLGGPDEYFHYQRIATVAYGHMLNEEAEVPSGIVQFLDKTSEFVSQGKLLPFSQENFFALSRIPLSPEATGKLIPSYMTVHNPVAYFPQALVFRLCAGMGASPLVLLYITRLTALLAGTFFTFHAIRIIPQWKYGLCAAALLPPLTFYRTCLSADTLTTAFGFLFLACVMREISRMDVVRTYKMLRLSFFAFLLAFCKFPYIACSFMALAIPHKRFASFREKLFWTAIIILPGLLAGLWWMEISRHGLFTDLQYTTWGGEVYPDGQFAYILSDPATFLAVLARTLFSISFYVSAISEMFGHFGTLSQSNPTYYIVLSLLLMIALWMDGTSVKVSYTLRIKSLVLPVFIMFLILTLTALYVHWTGWKAPTVKGFQGRYLYPMIPLFLMVLPFRGRPHSQASSSLAVTMFAVVGLSLTIPVLYAHWL